LGISVFISAGVLKGIEGCLFGGSGINILIGGLDVVVYMGRVVPAIPMDWYGRRKIAGAWGLWGFLKDSGPIEFGRQIYTI
jgi:hypothetical protein